MLRKDGTLFISIVHPLADLELLAVSGPGAPSETPATYFDRRRFETKVESRGLTMHFAGWAQPLEGYVSALESSGFAITSHREPTADLRQGRGHLIRWSRFPLFLWLKARPRPSQGGNSFALESVRTPRGRMQQRDVDARQQDEAELPRQVRFAAYARAFTANISGPAPIAKQRQMAAMGRTRLARPATGSFCSDAQETEIEHRYAAEQKRDP